MNDKKSPIMRVIHGIYDILYWGVLLFFSLLGIDFIFYFLWN